MTGPIIAALPVFPAIISATIKNSTQLLDQVRAFRRAAKDRKGSSAKPSKGAGVWTVAPSVAGPIINCFFANKALRTAAA